MKLITHNFLQCHAKGCNANNYPLKLVGVAIEHKDSEFNPEFLRNMLPKLEWAALVQTAESLGDTSLPAAVPADIDDTFLQHLHKVLLETHIQSGRMECPNCQHEFVIRDGIPCMLLTDLTEKSQVKEEAMETQA